MSKKKPISKKKSRKTPKNSDRNTEKVEESRKYPNLTTKEEIYVVMKAAGKKRIDIANAIGLTPEGIDYYLHKQEVKDALRQEQDSIIEAARAGYAKLIESAYSNVQNQIEGAPPAGDAWMSYSILKDHGYLPKARDQRSKEDIIKDFLARIDNAINSSE